MGNEATDAFWFSGYRSGNEMGTPDSLARYVQ
jgi:hypothetical protein